MNWWFGDTITGIAPDQTDFLSVAIREIAHVLGFGRAGSFTRWATFSSYVGPHVTALRGPSGAPLDTTTHEDWAEGTTSSIGGVGSFEAAMDPTLAPGQRKLLTDLDYAALADVGWEVGPIPDATALSLVPLLAIRLLRRARRQSDAARHRLAGEAAGMKVRDALGMSDWPIHKGSYVARLTTYLQERGDEQREITFADSGQD